MRYTSYAHKLKLSVIPLKPKSKEPAIPWAPFQTVPPTREQTEEWDQQFPDCNIGIVTGNVSGLVVLDVDSIEADQLISELHLPRTLKAKTSRGHHLYFKYPDKGVKNRVNIKGVHLDIRGDGGYVVAPPSIHPDGTVYKWENWG